MLVTTHKLRMQHDRSARKISTGWLLVLPQDGSKIWCQCGTVLSGRA